MLDRRKQMWPQRHYAEGKNWIPGQRASRLEFILTLVQGLDAGLCGQGLWRHHNLGPLWPSLHLSLVPNHPSFCELTGDQTSTSTIYNPFSPSQRQSPPLDQSKIERWRQANLQICSRRRMLPLARMGNMHPQKRRYGMKNALRKPWRLWRKCTFK